MLPQSTACGRIVTDWRLDAGVWRLPGAASRHPGGRHLLRRSAVIVALTVACSGSDPLGPPASAQIGLSTASLQLAGTAGSGQPQLAAIQVSNAGGGTLSGLAATVSYAGGSPSGWLTATLDGGVAPSTLRIAATAAGLPAGVFGATVVVSAPLADNSPRSIVVTFSVTADGGAVASIELSSPADTLLAVGRSVVLSAIARNTAGQVVSGAAFTWQSSNPSILTINAAGTAAAMAPGTAVVTAQAGGISATIRLRVVSANLAAISTLTADVYLQSLQQGLGTATRSRVGALLAGLATATQEGNLQALLNHVAALRTELLAAADPTDRAILATIVLFAERMQTLVAL